MQLRRKEYLLLVDSCFDIGSELLHVLLDTVDTTEGNQIGNASGDDTQTDEPGQRSACNVRILEAEEAEYGTGDTQKEDTPPGGETSLLVVKALDGNDYALDKNPRGEMTGSETVTNKLCPRKMKPRMI